MDRFIFEHHPSIEGWFRVTDNLYGYWCDFKAHEFNETQQYQHTDGLPLDADAVATIMRELGDWLVRNHSKEVFYEGR